MKETKCGNPGCSCGDELERERRGDRRRSIVVDLFFFVFIGVVAFLLDYCKAHAQQLPAPDPVVVALDAGTAAPFTGMLLPDDELVAWRREIERLRFELELAQQRADAMRAADAVLAAAQQRAGDERLALRESLWTERATTLTRERDAARARQGPRWWQRGALWLPVGIVVGIVTGAVLVAR